jgi:hypothetical protein
MMTLRQVKDDIFAQEPGRQARGCAQVSGAYRLAKDHDRLERENAEVDRLKADIEAYRGALGYSVAGDHDGRLSDGTDPVNGIAEALHRENAELRAALETATRSILTEEPATSDHPARRRAG